MRNLCFEINFDVTNNDDQVVSNSGVEAVDIVQKRVDWDKADISKYQILLNSFLAQNFEIWISPENLSILAAVIPTSFTQAAELSGPTKSNKKPNFKVFKSEEWLKAERLAKNASKKWLKAGKPRSEDNQIFKAKKETNNQLRKAIKMHNNKETTEENNKMMQANFRDPKLFSNLVNKKKTSSAKIFRDFFNFINN